MDTILVVEDTESLREVLCAVLTCEGYEVTGSKSAEEAVEVLRQREFSLVICDLKLPGKTGLDFLREAKSLCPRLPFVVMTAYGTVDIAVQAMKDGATDFITKPFDPAMLCNLISQVMIHKRIVERDSSRAIRRPRQFITQNAATDEMLQQARKVAPLTSTVLLLGESGTGKELIARYIHDHSRRADKPFVAVNCASLPLELLESEFFGHEAGAFTGATEERAGLFEIADTGTIFLDEIGNMPSSLQVKLLRTLQEGEIKKLGSSHIKKVDVRVISATNCNLNDAMKIGSFREDLFYRLGVMILEIPPLRDRREDIELLLNYFSKLFAAEFERPAPTFTPEAMRKLRDYSWPGNVRELENIIERALVFSEGSITPDKLPLQQVESEVDDTVRPLLAIASAAQKEAEVCAILRVLAETRWNKSRAAKKLGISYKTLLNKVKEYELKPTN